MRSSAGVGGWAGGCSSGFPQSGLGVVWARVRFLVVAI